MININGWMIEQRIANNEYHANAIFYGLKLQHVQSDDERMKRCRLYRDWRKSGVFGEDTKPCYEKAMAGEEVPQLIEGEA